MQRMGPATAYRASGRIGGLCPPLWPLAGPSTGRPFFASTCVSRGSDGHGIWTWTWMSSDRGRGLCRRMTAIAATLGFAKVYPVRCYALLSVIFAWC